VEPPANGHEDHIGGVPALYGDFRPREIWTGATPDSPLWRAVYDKPAQTGAKIVSMPAGRSFGLGGAEVEVLARAAAYIPLDEPKNNDSLVMRPWYGQRSFLLSGDVERPIERCVRPMY